MGSVFFQQGLQVDQLAGIGVADQFFAGQAGLEQHIRQFAGRKHLLLGLLPVGAAFVLLKGEGNTGAFLHPCEKLIGFPVVVAVFAVVARHGKSGFRSCCGHREEQNAQRKAQKTFQHSLPPFKKVKNRSVNLRIERHDILYPIPTLLQRKKFLQK